MEVEYPGHSYLLNHLDGDSKTILQFVQRAPLHPPKEGVTNQEVLRALIDRIKILEAEVHWDGNYHILWHLRMALVLHEARALIRHVEKGDIAPEAIPTGPDGHFIFGGSNG